MQATAAALADGSFVLAPGLSTVLLEHAAEVARLTRLAPEVLQGRSLVHSDLRPDNLLVDRSGRGASSTGTGCAPARRGWTSSG